MLVVRALRLWRTFTSFGRSVGAALGVVTETAASTEAHAVAVAQRTERLTVAVARLQESLDRLRVLNAAASEIRRTVTGVRGAVPKK